MYAIEQFVIESDVVMPEREWGTGRKPIYPFGQMKVGDSFMLPKKLNKKVMSASNYFGRRNGKKFSVLKVKGGYRCWRIK